MSTSMDIEFLDTLGRQIESIDEISVARRARTRRLLTIAAATLALGIAVLGAVGGWSRWIADGTGGAGAGSGGGGQAGHGSLPVPSPVAPGPGHIRGPAIIPNVPVLTSITSDPSGRIWLAGRNAEERTDWVAYLEGGAWHTLPLPEKVAGRIFAPVSPADVWFAADGGFWHWDGTTAAKASVPFLDGDVGWPTDMTSTATDDVWAVGHRLGTPYKSLDDGPGEHTAGYLPVAMHWDGSAWVDLKVPEYPGRSSRLVAVSASGGDAWAVGYYSVKLGEREQSGGGPPMEITRQGPIVVRWTGDYWAAVDTTGLGADDLSLQDVKVLGPNDVWVLGEENLGGTRSAQVIAHWDSAGWTRIPSPDGVRKNDDHARYTSLSATSNADLWLAGDGRLGAGDAELAHWDGASWQVLPMTEIEAEDRRGGGTIGAAMADVVALGAADVWLNPGFTSFTTDAPEAAIARLAHWDGATWSQVTTPGTAAASD